VQNKHLGLDMLEFLSKKAQPLDILEEKFLPINKKYLTSLVDFNILILNEGLYSLGKRAGEFQAFLHTIGFIT
jgi:hypothetical protein